MSDFARRAKSEMVAVLVRISSGSKIPDGASASSASTHGRDHDLHSTSRSVALFAEGRTRVRGRCLNRFNRNEPRSGNSRSEFCRNIGCSSIDAHWRRSLTIHTVAGISLMIAKSRSFLKHKQRSSRMAMSFALWSYDLPGIRDCQPGVYSRKPIRNSRSGLWNR